MAKKIIKRTKDGETLYFGTHTDAVLSEVRVGKESLTATLSAIITSFASYYTKSETYSQAEVDQLVSAIKQFNVVVAASLPTASASTMNTIYLIPSSHSEQGNVKDEFITIQDGGSYKWEQIGTTAIDLSDYPTTTEMNAAIASALSAYSTTSAMNAAIASAVESEEDRAKASVGYYVCDTAAGTAAKTVSAAGYTLAVGGNMRIKMTNANTAANATLNISSTGAKALLYNGEQVSADNSWKAGEVLTVYYDGTNFVSAAATDADTEKAIDELTEMVVYEYDGSMSEIIDAAGQRVASNIAPPLDFPIRLKSFEFGINRLQAIHTQYPSVTSIDMPLAVCSVDGNSATVVGSYVIPIPIDGSTSVIDISNMSIDVPAGHVVCVYNTTYNLFGTRYVNQSDESLRSFYKNDGNMAVGTVIPRSDRYQYTIGVKLNYARYEGVKNKVSEIEESIEAIESDIVDMSGHLVINESGVYGTAAGGSSQRGMRGNYSTFDDRIKMTTVNLDLERLQAIHTQYPSVTSVNMPIGIAKEDDDVVSLSKLYKVAIPIDGSTFSVDVADMNIEVDKGEFLCFDATAYFLFGTPYTNSTTGTTYVFGNTYDVGTIGSRDVSHAWEQKVQVEYVIQTPIDEYVKEHSSGSSDTVCDRDSAESILVIGSSLSTASNNVSGFGWVDRLNDVLDINIVNNAHSGHGLDDNINDIAINRALMYDGSATAQTIHPTYLLCNNQANSTQTGVGGYYQLSAAKEVAESLGAKLLLGGEEGYVYNLSAARTYELTYAGFAKDNGLPCSPIRREWVKCYPSVNTPYPGFEHNSHGGYRTTAMYWTHLEMLRTLPVVKNVKMFKVRPTYKNGSPTADQLLYDDNIQRLRYFTAISAGCHTAINSGHLDNIDQDSNTFDASGGVESPFYDNSETSRMIRGSWTEITFNKFGLIEFILEKTAVKNVDIEFCASVEPTAIYVAITQNPNAVIESATESVRSFWLDIDTFTYDSFSKKVQFHLSRDNGDMQLYDKIRVLVEYSGGAFQMGNPAAKNYDGNDKVTPCHIYCNRRYGIEINGNTSFDSETGDSSTWTLSGNAVIASFPSQIAMYPSYNASARHLELPDNTSHANKTISVPEGCLRVAVRVVAQSFIPVMTTRFAGTDISDSPYISETALLSPYEYDYDVLRLTVNDNYIEERVVLQGWMVLYYEFDVYAGDTSLKLDLQRNSYVDTASYPNQTNRKLIIYDVSVQKIE